jgi:hypothetical protein
VLAAPATASACGLVTAALAPAEARLRQAVQFLRLRHLGPGAAHVDVELHVRLSPSRVNDPGGRQQAAAEATRRGGGSAMVVRPG